MGIPQLFYDIGLFVAGFVFLVAGAELLVRGAGRIAVRFRVPSVVVGLTVVAFGTSLPELLVSTLANLRGEGAIAIGNIVGSNIANLGLILGVGAAMAVLGIERHLVRREYPMMMIVTLLFVGVIWNGGISRLEGLLLLCGLVAFTVYSYRSTRITAHELGSMVDVAETIDPGVDQPSTKLWLDGVLMVVGLGGLVLGASWLVTGASSIALRLGVSELVIGLTLVAFGTSLPELATTVVAVMRKEGDIAVGNVVGSNIFNVLFIGGFTALLRPLPVPPHMMAADIPVLLAFTGIVYVMVLPLPHRLRRWQGGALLLGYATYVVWLFVRNSTGA